MYQAYDLFSKGDQRMSVQTVRDFWQRVKQDSALQEQLRGVPRIEKAQAITAIIPIATAAGFKFTAEDYEAAVREVLARQHSAGELSEEQLADVAAALRQTGYDEGTC
jgi:predicted ribosomally synthesized peptide with nif11-like leader